MAGNKIAMTEKSKAPPYVEYRPFEVFISAAKQKLPNKVDKKYLEDISVAKSARQTLLVTLRFLGLIDPAGKPTLALPPLLKEGAEFTKSRQELTKSVYADLLAQPNIAFGDRLGITLYFQERYALNPYTAKRCASFFVRLAKDARLLSTRQKGRRSLESKKSMSGQRADLLATKAELLRKLPDFRNGWQPEEIQLVLQQFERLLAHLEK